MSCTDLGSSTSNKSEDECGRLCYFILITVSHTKMAAEMGTFTLDLLTGWHYSNEQKSAQEWNHVYEGYNYKPIIQDTQELV